MLVISKVRSKFILLRSVIFLLILYVTGTNVIAEDGSGLKNVTKMIRDPFFSEDHRLIASVQKTNVVSIDETREAQLQKQNKDIQNKAASSGEQDTVDLPLASNGSVKFPVSFNNLDQNSPDSFKAMVESIQKGDRQGAKEGAMGFVGYLRELMYMVREITHYTVEAMVEDGEKDEEEVRGVEELLEWNMAQARKASNLPVKPNQKTSLEKIKQPDSEGKAEVYFFFALNCKYCREMAPDVQRLAFALKDDKRVKITGYVIGKPPKDIMKSFVEYTGLDIPIFPGEEAAKTLRMSFMPSLLVVSPSNNTSYLRTGGQSYKHMFEFVRKVQGLPLEMDKKQIALASLSIGQIGTLQKGGVISTVKDTSSASASVNLDKF